MSVRRIDSLDTPELEAYRGLTDHPLRSSVEARLGLMVCESEICVRTALGYGARPHSMLLDEKRVEGLSDLIEGLGDEVDVMVADSALMRQLTGYTVTRGVLCACERPELIEAGQAIDGARHIVVLEDIVDTTNVGAIFRSAAALGADAVLLSPSCADPLARRALRVSMGNVLALPWARVEGEWPASLFALLGDGGVVSAAMALDERAVSIDEPALKEAGRIALILGTEGTGLSEATIAGSDFIVRIPMARGVDSLNVAAASALACWELFSRRT